MKHLKSLSALAVALTFSQFSYSESVEFTGELNLVGFSGGTCNINVIPNANATSLNLDDFVQQLNVGSVETQCDYDYRVTVDGETSPFVGGDFALTHVDDNSLAVPYVVFVDGFGVGGFEGEFDLGYFIAGENRTMPVEIDTFDIAPYPGIYQGSLTFSVIVD